MKNLGIFSLLLLLVFSSCRKDINEVNITKTTPAPTIENYNPPSESVMGSVIGLIVDENNTPIPDAEVKWNNQTFITDTYGHFFLVNKTLNALGTLVQVEVDGYFKGSRRFFPREGETSRIKIVMLEKAFDFDQPSFNALDGGTVSFDSGASIEFLPNSIKTSNGDPYTGVVHVASKWMEPNDPNTIFEMPGNLFGLNTNVEEVTLGTYGMIAVELQGDANESLNIADGKTAKIKMAIPDEMLNDAPAEIPLWSYNEEFGLWVEESFATLENGSYVGEVSHFSFWNCDIPFAAIYLDMTLVDSNGSPVVGYWVMLNVVGGGGGSIPTSGSGVSDGNGNVSGFVPYNETLSLEVRDECGNVISTQQIGPFLTNTSLGNITISPSSINSTTISGNLVDCNDDPINNGLVLISFQGTNIYHYTSTSNFSVSFSTCSLGSDIEVIGVNLDDFSQSTPILTVSTAQNDLGNIEVCNNTFNQNYILVTVTNGVNSTTTFFGNAVANMNGTGTYFWSQGIDLFAGIGFDGQTVGDYGNLNFIEGLSDSSQGWSFDGSVNAGFPNFEVTQFDSKIVGTFSGELYNTIDSMNVWVSGEFNVSF